MKFQTKYEIGDVVLIKGSHLEIERVLTIQEIVVQSKKEWLDHAQPFRILYGFKESFWIHDEKDVLKKVVPK